MTNFRKVSRFDEWEKPPEPDYRDWNRADTRVISCPLDELSYLESVDWISSNFGPILEEISGPEVSVEQNTAYFRVYKPGKDPLK